MKKHLRLSVILVSCFFCNNVMACMFMGEINHSHEIVIDEADSIVLAKAISYEPQTRGKREIMGFVHFQTVEILKGTSPNKFRINARESSFIHTLSIYFFKYAFLSYYLVHDDEDFWLRNTGRTTSHDTMCILTPDFSIGSTYLIIKGKKQDSKNYELIAFKSDKWLKYVRNRLNHNASLKKFRGRL